MADPFEETYEPSDADKQQVAQLMEQIKANPSFLQWLMQMLQGESKQDRLARRHQDWTEQQERTEQNRRELVDKGIFKPLPYHNSPVTKKLDRDPAEPWPDAQ